MSQSFEDTTAVLAGLRENDDRSRWVAGDVVVAFLGSSEHADDDTASTIASLAAHSGFERGGLRERYHCSLFYPVGVRLWEIASWSIYNRARRAVDLETACDHVEWADKRSASVARFERALRRWKRMMGMSDPRDVGVVVLPVECDAQGRRVVYLSVRWPGAQRVRVRMAE